MRLEHPEYLWLLTGVVILVMSFVWAQARRRKQRSLLGDESLVDKLMPDRSRTKFSLRFYMIAFAYCFLVVGMANPQVGTKQETVKRNGVDIVIALDLSNSMMAEDTRPNRLERSKRFIESLLDKFQNDRVAFIIFAGNAYLQMPLTIDYSAFALYLHTVDTDLIPTQGTALGDAIQLAEKAFNAGERKHKALILISDGENHEEEAVEMAKEAYKNGTKIYTVGVGTRKGGPIPIYNKYGHQVDFKKNKEGSIVLSKLNEKMLQEIALHGGGKYFRMSSGRESVKELMKNISELETKEIEEQIYTDYEDQFQFFLFFGLVLILAELFISTRKSRWWHQLKLFEA